MNTIVIEKVTAVFREKFQQDPLLIFAPGRINLIGEHTDYNEGYVFPAAINKGIYLAIAPTAENHSNIIAIDAKKTLKFSMDKIRKRNYNTWKNYILGIVHELQTKGIQLSNVNAVFGGDIPVGSGLSSSAALENAFAFGFNELFNLGLDKMTLTQIAQKAEHNFVGVQCGIMDQFASMFGKKDKALLLDCKDLSYTIHPLHLKAYELVLINTNVSHSLASSAYNERRAVCEQVSKLLNINSLREATLEDLHTIKDQISTPAYQQATYVIEENQRVLDAAKALESGDITRLGELLFLSHKGLSEQYLVSCEELDFLVEKARNHTAVIGARMMGGGFGGCTINLVRSTQKEIFLSEIQQTYFQQFNNHCSVYEVTTSNGTQIITL